MWRIALAALAALFVPAQASAQDEAEATISAEQKSEIVQTLGEKLRNSYVFPERAERTADELLIRLQSGAYSSYDTPETFADALRTDLREVGGDRHFQVRYDPSFTPPSHDANHSTPSGPELAEMKRQLALQAYGVYRTARLPGNVGYIDVRFFGPTEYVAPAYESAMQMVAGMSAVIVDMRSNGGGDPASVAQLVSHFFAKGDERHLNSIYNRIEDRTREFWVVRSTNTRFTGPVYVLTSDYTFSGGEEFSYDLQTQGRAPIIGETTGGGANPGAPVGLGHGLYAFIPTGRAINPVTQTNWEHVGVKPDHAVTAEEAMVTAYRMALEAIAAAESDPPTREEYNALAQSDLAAIPEFPRWKHPRER